VTYRGLGILGMGFLARIVGWGLNHQEGRGFCARVPGILIILRVICFRFHVAEMC
jgi:ABC-type dipeptide/oligopeptide/nickel transport system permease subunit